MINYHQDSVKNEKQLQKIVHLDFRNCRKDNLIQMIFETFSAYIPQCHMIKNYRKTESFQTLALIDK